MSTLLPHRPSSGRPLALRVDIALVLTTLVVACVGVVIVYSSTRSKDPLQGLSTHYYLNRQAAFVIVGALVMVGLAALDYHWLEHASAVLYVGTVLALLSMFTPIGSSAKGATRWIQVGPIQIQPSSFAIPVLIVTVATFCARRPEGLSGRDLAKVLGLAAVPILLVVKQPDLASGIVLCIVLLVMLVVAGIPNRYLVLLLLGAVLGAFAVLHLGLLKSYQVDRLTSFLHPTKNLQGSNYNPHQSVAAIGSGGLFGKGLFHGPQTNLAYVPEQQTDFIFSAVGEQLGFVGSASVLLLLGIVSWRLLPRRPDVARRLRPAAGRRIVHLHRLQRLRERRNGHGDHAGGRHPVAVPELRRVGHGGLLQRHRHGPVGRAPTPTMTETGPDDDAAPAGLDPGTWRLAVVAGVRMDMPGDYPEVLVHEAVSPWRELAIPVGMAEGNAIAYAWRGLSTPRPLSHALFTELLERHGVQLEAVRITARRGRSFFAELDTTGPRGRQVVPCRPSDALALVLRQRMPTPVLVADWVFDPEEERPRPGSRFRRRHRRVGTGRRRAPGHRDPDHRSDPALIRPPLIRHSEVPAGPRRCAYPGEGPAVVGTTGVAVASEATMARSPSSEMRMSRAMST